MLAHLKSADRSPFGASLRMRVFQDQDLLESTENYIRNIYTVGALKHVVDFHHHNDNDN